MVQNWFCSIARDEAGWTVSGSSLYLFYKQHRVIGPKSTGACQLQERKGKSAAAAGAVVSYISVQLWMCVHLCTHIFLCNFRHLLKLKDSHVPPSPHPHASAYTCDWIISLTPKRLCLPLCLFAHVLTCVCKETILDIVPNTQRNYLLYFWDRFPAGPQLGKWASLADQQDWRILPSPASSTDITNLCHYT